MTSTSVAAKIRCFVTVIFSGVGLTQAVLRACTTIEDRYVMNRVARQSETVWMRCGKAPGQDEKSRQNVETPPCSATLSCLGAGRTTRSPVRETEACVGFISCRCCTRDCRMTYAFVREACDVTRVVVQGDSRSYQGLSRQYSKGECA